MKITTENGYMFDTDDELTKRKTIKDRIQDAIMHLNAKIIAEAYSYYLNKLPREKDENI